MFENIPRILITPGEPAGIGPEITVKLAEGSWPAEIIAVCDPQLLETTARKLQLSLSIKEFNFKNPRVLHEPQTIKVIPVPLSVPSEASKLNSANAHYVLQCLELATAYCLNGLGDALVTGPVHKGVMKEAGIDFLGHTEFLAKRCQVNDVIMVFVVDHLKVALLTTHIPLANVSEAITREKLLATVRLLNSELKKRFNLNNPTILVCGLNPHAGEMGHLGREEIDIIQPALEELRRESVNVIGPLPADTLFTQKYLKKGDAILAMYHDQALPVVKYVGFESAVNVTLGLPIIRTSVDHGTALDIAGTNQASPESLKAAVRLAIELATNHVHSL